MNVFSRRACNAGFASTAGRVILTSAIGLAGGSASAQATAGSSSISRSFEQNTGLNLSSSQGLSKSGSVSRLPSGMVTLNLENSEIEAVARVIADITGRNVVVDPRVKGSITLLNEKAVSRTEAIRQFYAALRLQGFTIVESAGLYKVVPEAEGKLQSEHVVLGETTGDRREDIPGNQITTQIFKLNFESASNLLPLLRPLISPNNVININPSNNSIVITDYADNLRRIAKIIAASDVPNAGDVEILALKHSIASDLAPLILRLLDVSGAPASGGSIDIAFRTVVVAEPRSNTLIVRAANPARLGLVKAMVAKLDQPTSQSDNGAAGNIHVVYLKNADATKLAVTLRAALSSESRPPAAGTTSGAPGTPSGGQVQADAATNSLIITAPEPQFRQLRAVIDHLDGRRGQVFVESLIAEVSADRAAEFGIQWQGALGKSGDSIIGLLGTNFGAGGGNILNLSTQLASGNVLPQRGFNLGVAPKTNGIYALGVLARFLEETGSGNVLSTPNLLTLDNEEAKIVIGQNVPFVTGQFTNTNAGNGAVNPFQTIERRDVGLTLRVKPQISENGTVRLTIYQEVSSVLASTANASNGPTTNKRTIESNVLVENGAVVVLGGLLQDEYSGSEEKIPGLSEAPLLGNLFKSESRSRKKTNLMVFLRPVVMRDAAATERFSLDRYDFMRANLNAAQPRPSLLVPINNAPQMPSLKPASTAPSSEKELP